jgi:hypothetical protein
VVATCFSASTGPLRVEPALCGLGTTLRTLQTFLGG